MTYEIKTANESEIRLMLDWALKEGWNPGVNDHISFQSADPNGFFIGYLDKIPVASLSAIKYSNRFGFIGLYIVKSEFRGKGLGIKIWNHGIEYLKGVDTLGLDGVIEQQDNYKKSGFHLMHRNIRHSGIAPDINNSTALVNLKNIPLETILEFEHNLFPCKRALFLRSWIDCAENAFAFMQNDKMMGYGIIRKCDKGFKIGPLFAKNYDVAEQLFLGLCNPFQGQQITLDTPESNQHAIRLAQNYHLKPSFETARMYTNTNPQLELSNIFGITSFELG